MDISREERYGRCLTLEAIPLLEFHPHSVHDAHDCTKVPGMERWMQHFAQDEEQYRFQSESWSRQQSCSWVALPCLYYLALTAIVSQAMMLDHRLASLSGPCPLL